MSQVIRYGGDDYLTADAVAEAVLDYAVALGGRGLLGVAELPVWLGDGSVGTARLVVGKDLPIAASHSMPHIMEVYREVKAKLPGKPITIGEVGWPSEGRSRRDAIPSRTEAAGFIADFMQVAKKEGLSYSTYTLFSANAIDEAAHFGVSSIFAPQNRERVERAIREELERAVREGFSAEEIKTGKQALLEQRRMARTQDRALAHRLSSYLFIKRTFAWDTEFEGRIAALTPEQVNAALRRHFDPAKLSLVTAGDFKQK